VNPRVFIRPDPDPQDGDTGTKQVRRGLLFSTGEILVPPLDIVDLDKLAEIDATGIPTEIGGIGDFVRWITKPPPISPTADFVVPVDFEIPAKSDEIVIQNTKGLSSPEQVLEEVLRPFYTLFSVFNRELFNSELVPVAILVQRGGRQVAGHYAPKRLAHRNSGQKLDEISINPKFLIKEPIEFSGQTIAHEMVHHWEEYAGKPPRGNYHTKRWAAKAVSIGLEPFNVDDPSKQTGQRVSDRIIPGGRFDRVFREMIAGGFRIDWGDCVEDDAGKGKPSRARNVEYFCPQCGLSFKQRPGLPLACSRDLIALQCR
jgi:hypothetical protein